MADQITAKNTDAKFSPHPEGQFLGICCDVVDMLEKIESYPGTPDKLSRKVTIIFRTGEVNLETGVSIDIAREFTLSMGEKANLRKFLEDWRGKSYTQEQADEGVPLHKMVGVGGLLSVEHKTSGKGRIYANIKGIAPIPKQMKALPLPTLDGYERPSYYTERKAQYAKEAAEFRAKIGAPRPVVDDFGSEPFEDDDSLPF